MRDFLLRHKVLVGIWAGVLLIGGYAGYTIFFKSSGNDNPYVLTSNSSQNNDEQEAAEPEDDTPKLRPVSTGEAAKDGDFEFTVTGVSCGESKMGSNEYAHDVAVGEYCRLKMSATNNSDDSKSIPAQRMMLVDSQGESYPFDGAATLYAQNDINAPLWYENVAAGNTVSGDIVFDVPTNVTPLKTLIFGAEDSSGLEVNLD